MASLTNVSTPEQIQSLLMQPAGKPPAGVIPNFDNPRNLNVPVALILTLWITIPALATLMRIYTKVFLIKSLAYEDYAIILGWVLLTVDEAVFWVTTTHGGHGVHIWNLHLGTVFKILYWLNVTAIVYTPAEFLIRLSILLQFLRIFIPHQREDKFTFYTIHGLIWCNGLFYLIKFIGLLALCVPRKKLWEPWTPGGHCDNADTWFIASGIFNVLSDFAILIVPLRCVYELQLPSKKKIMVALIFATGTLACVASILRTYYTFRIAQGPDVTFNIVVMGLGGTAELNIGVVVSCLPVLPRFVRHFGPKFTRSFSFHSASTLDANRRARFAHKLNCLLGRAPAPKQHHSWSRSTTSVPRIDSNTVEQEIDRSYVTIDLHRLDPLEERIRNKSLPLIPTSDKTQQNAKPTSDEIETSARID